MHRELTPLTGGRRLEEWCGGIGTRIGGAVVTTGGKRQGGERESEEGSHARAYSTVRAARVRAFSRGCARAAVT